MHPALCIPEVLKTIVECFGTGHDPTAIDGKTLINLTLTCRAFLEIALDELWRVQKSLDALLMCFPTDTYTVTPQRVRIFRDHLVTSRIQSIRRVQFKSDYIIRPEDWKRVNYYAPRIRYLRPQQGASYPLVAVPEIWPLLELLRPPSLPYLLPNLKSVDFESAEGDFYNIRQFLVPQLRHLQFCLPWNGSPSPLRISFLLTLSSLCPQLSSLCITNFPKGILSRETLSRWQSLRKLKVANINPEDLLSLGSMASLQTLEVDGIERPGVASSPAETASNLFATLKCLRLMGTGSTFTVACTILNAVASTELCSLFLVIDPTRQEGDDLNTRWKELVHAILPFQATITTLHIQGLEDRRASSDQLIDGEVFRPLEILQWLQDLKITSTIPITMTDEIFGACSSQWPHIRRLIFTNSASPNHYAKRDSTSLQALLFVLTNCRSLEYLDICLDTEDNVPSVEDDMEPWKKIANKRIEVIGLGRPSYKESVGIALFLSAILPNLRSIRIPEGCKGVSKTEWGEVERHLQAIRIARRWK